MLHKSIKREQDWIDLVSAIFYSTFWDIDMWKKDPYINHEENLKKIVTDKKLSTGLFSKNRFGFLISSSHKQKKPALGEGKEDSKTPKPHEV